MKHVYRVGDVVSVDFAPERNFVITEIVPVPDGSPSVRSRDHDHPDDEFVYTFAMKGLILRKASSAVKLQFI